MRDRLFFTRILILDGKDKKRRPQAPLPWRKKDGSSAGGRRPLNPEAWCLSTNSSRTQGKYLSLCSFHIKKNVLVMFCMSSQITGHLRGGTTTGPPSRHGRAVLPLSAPYQQETPQTRVGASETTATTGRRGEGIALSFGKVQMPRCNCVASIQLSHCFKWKSKFRSMLLWGSTTDASPENMPHFGRTLVQYWDSFCVGNERHHFILRMLCALRSAVIYWESLQPLAPPTLGKYSLTVWTGQTLQSH